VQDQRFAANTVRPGPYDQASKGLHRTLLKGPADLRIQPRARHVLVADDGSDRDDDVQQQKLGAIGSGPSKRFPERVFGERGEVRRMKNPSDASVVGR
jgi:hypothetical protein